MTILVNFWAGRSHGIGEEPLFYLTQQQEEEECFYTPSTVVIVSIDLTALFPSCSIGFSQLRGTFITTGLGLTGVSFKRPVMGFETKTLQS